MLIHTFQFVLASWFCKQRGSCTVLPTTKTAFQWMKKGIAHPLLWDNIFSSVSSAVNMFCFDFLFLCCCEICGFRQLIVFTVMETGALLISVPLCELYWVQNAEHKYIGTYTVVLPTPGTLAMVLTYELRFYSWNFHYEDLLFSIVLKPMY